MGEYILQKLLTSGNDYVSGSSLSQHFDVTRSAVWKEIAFLRRKGFSIEAAPKKGYRLISYPNRMNKVILKHFLSNSMWGEIIHLKSIPSTNTFLKNYETLKEGIAVFADSQSNGRGRRGRSWHSPNEGNIYLSVSLKPDLLITDMPVISLLAGLAVSNAIEKYCSLKCGIKWPNDIVINGKKVCGVLCEITGEIEGGFICIVGIGVNVNNSIFPNTISTPATSIISECKCKIDINKFAAEILKSIEFEYKNIHSFIKRYKEKCVTLNKEVKVISEKEEFIATAVNIANDGALIVKKDSSEIRINSGEVSVRGIYGYV